MLVKSMYLFVCALKQNSLSLTAAVDTLTSVQLEASNKILLSSVVFKQLLYSVTKVDAGIIAMPPVKVI